MAIFSTTLSQMAFLFSLIIVGYLMAKLGAVQNNAAGVLAKMENFVFIPALVMVTFIDKFTVESLSTMWKPLVVSIVVLGIVIPLALLAARLLSPKDRYLRNIYTYGLCFSNFGFMGNAIVSQLYPDFFFEYLIFTLPLWTGIYVWGAPSLLMSESGRKMTVGQRLKSFWNPMFIAMVIGMIIGLSGLQVPAWIGTTLNSASNCMSPVAMLLTGITVASTDLKKTFTNLKIYLISAVRLLLFPAIALAALYFIPLKQSTLICVVCSLAMPLGLNTIVIPSAYGKDTTEAAGMAIVSHLLSCITIPLVLLAMSKFLL